MKPKRKRSAVEIRRGQITRQLERLRSRLATKSPSQYSNETAYEHGLERTRELISELECELLMLDCPGEYAELPASVVADELRLSCERVRGLIMLGEIEATGRTAHERISRVELERIAALGPNELLRLSREESAEIFEQALLCLQTSDLNAVEKAYRRLEARLSWRGPYAPAFLVGLELAKGDLDGALSSVKLIYEHDDLLQKMAVMTYLGRVLRGMRLSEKGAQELCGMLTALAEEGGTTRIQGRTQGRKRPSGKAPTDMQRQAAYLTTSVLRKYMRMTSNASPQVSGREVVTVVRDALYTALYAEAFYDDDAACSLYADMTRVMTPKGPPPTLLIALAGKGRRARK